MSEHTHENKFYDSDSFISENDDQSSPRKKISSQPISRSKRERDAKQIYTNNGKSQRNKHKRLMNKQLHPVQFEVSAQRILSARNHKIIDQTNAIHHLSKQIEELKNENKTLKTQAFRQEKALNKIETKQTDLPRILDQHEAELCSVKELLRRSKEAFNAEIKQRKEADCEIVKLRDNLARAHQLIGNKNLDEKSILQSQINDLQEKLYTKEKSLESSNKHIENLEKTHKQEIYSLKKQMKKYFVRCQDLEKELKLIRINLKEKEKLLEIQNIYSQRFKTIQKFSNNDRHNEGLYSSGPQTDQLLDKLDFSGAYQRKDEKDTEEIFHSPMSAGAMFNEERIKQDIRKIIEEELLSGRIKPFETNVRSAQEFVNDSPHRALGQQSNDGRSTVQDSYNTDVAVESEIFDKEPLTQIQSVPDIAKELEINQEELDEERRQRKLLLEKLSRLDSHNIVEDRGDSSKLSYSYPHDKDYLANDESVSEIETIPTVNAQEASKTYKFSNTVDNLHKGVPVQQNNSKQSRSSISKTSQIEASHNQKNNSNVETFKEETLPPLNSGDKKRKESELLSELFGNDFTPQPIVHGRPYPTGARQSRSGGLLWVNDNEIVTKPSQDKSVFMKSNNNVDLDRSEDIEEIVL